MTIGEQTTRYAYNSNGDLTKVIYSTSTAVKYSWNQFGFLSGITSFNREDKLIQAVYFSYDWNGKVTMSRQPQGDSAELVFNEEGKMMDVSGDGISDVRYESVKTDDQVIRIIKQGDQVQVNAVNTLKGAMPRGLLKRSVTYGLNYQLRALWLSCVWISLNNSRRTMNGYHVNVKIMRSHSQFFN